MYVTGASNEAVSFARPGEPYARLRLLPDGTVWIGNGVTEPELLTRTGAVLCSGVGAPSSTVGLDGDFYIDTGAVVLYGPKTAGVWGSATLLVGPPGPKGDPGLQGAKGDPGAIGPKGDPGDPRIVQDHGLDLPQRIRLNFAGEGAVVTDDGTGVITVTVAKRGTSGETNFKARSTAGVRVANRSTGTPALPPARAGVSVLEAPKRALSTQRPGVRCVPFTSGSPFRPRATPGIRTGAVMVAAKPNPRAGARVLQTKVALNGVYGANAAVESAVGGKTNWADEGNAVGKANGTFATFSGSSTASRAGRMDLSYADFVSKGHFTITKVLLRFFAKMTGAPLLGLATPISFQWAKGGAATTVATRTGNFDSTVTPIEVDITAGITGWADLDALQTFVEAKTATLETPTISLDAVHLVVDAEHTEVL